MKKNLMYGLAATAAVAVATLGVAAPATAADGDQFVTNGTFGAVPVNELAAPSSTEFTPANLSLFGEWANRDQGTMYDPGTFTVASNPASLHEFWVEFPENDPMMIVNGHTEGSHVVWQQTAALPDCEDGSTLDFAFSMEATNVLRPGIVPGEAGANLSVFFNDVEVAVTDLTGSDPTDTFEFTTTVEYAPVVTVKIVNNATQYSGNDFAIDDISLTQVGECQPPCVPTVTGVWHNYTGKFTGTGMPSLDDPKWHALPATPGGEHELADRGLDKPYQPGKDKGKGDWFVWKTAASECVDA